jgi:hypothetical protein
MVMSSLYPPLRRCLLIESEQHSRFKTRRLLESANLFSSLIEVRSLADALHRVRSQDFGSCVLGSSLDSESIRKFIETGRRVSRSRDCLFVHFCAAGTADRVAAADAVFDISCSAADILRGLMALGAERSGQATDENETQSLQQDRLMDCQAQRLERIRRNVLRGRLGLSAVDGRDSNTEQELQKLVNGLLLHRTGRGKQPLVRRELLQAFRSWVHALAAGRPAEAHQQLSEAVSNILVS